MSATYALREGLVVTTREGATFLTDLHGGEVYEMNETAALILDTLRRGGTAEGAAEALRARYPEAPRDEVGRDVATLVEAMRAQGFLLPAQDETRA